jgi:hypothetical protein
LFLPHTGRKYKVYFHYILYPGRQPVKGYSVIESPAGYWRQTIVEFYSIMYRWRGLAVKIHHEAKVMKRR